MTEAQVGMDRKVVFSVTFEAVCSQALTARQVNDIGFTVSAQHGKLIAKSSEITLHSRCPAWIVTEREENTMSLIIPSSKSCSWEGVSAW